MTEHSLYRCAVCLFVLLVMSGASALAHGDGFLVRDGMPRAQIVTAPDAPPMVNIAADELQTHIRKMTGATLPIVTGDADQQPVSIYVGKSAHTKRLGVTAGGLKDGAFRMKSGDNWLVLLGDDTEFEPTPPYSVSGKDADQQAVMDEWDRRTGGTYANPNGTWNRRYNHELDIFTLDKRGSLNAVHRFLRDQGVEWYMPTELGTYIPEKRNIALPDVDKTVRPDFALRCMGSITNNIFSMPREQLMWTLRMGLNSQSEKIGRARHHGHGMTGIHSRPIIKRTHPEYYSVVNGRRQNYHRHGEPCLSSEELFERHVDYVRSVFDVYDVKGLGLMPADSYGQVCECQRCAGQGTPGRGFHGKMSDYVWPYIDRVARAIYKSHPDKLVSCYAYNTYTLPPRSIDKLSPNLMVGIVHGRSGDYRDAETRGRAEQIRRQWLQMSNHELLAWEHYPLTNRGVFWPAYEPHKIARNLQMTQPYTEGEYLGIPWGPMGVRGHGLHAPGFGHLNVYVTARLYWDAEQYIDSLLNEYYQQFYGPAADEMQQFISYCESNWRDLQADAEKMTRVLELLDAAQQTVSADSVYGERIAMVADYLKPLANRRDQVAKGRQNVPSVRLRGRGRGEPAIKIDGRFDESAWEGLPHYEMRNLQTGRKPSINTSFRMFWSYGRGGDDSGALCIAIRCEDPDMEGLRIGTTEDGDNGLWDGDCIELLIETQQHSYYQIAIAPSGARVELDRRADQMNFTWSSGAEIATHVADTHWNVEIRLPVSASDRADDPNFGVIGQRPIGDYPWYMNVCRQRIRQDERGMYAFSPTGSPGFHKIMKFGKVSLP